MKDYLSHASTITILNCSEEVSLGEGNRSSHIRSGSMLEHIFSALKVFRLDHVKTSAERVGNIKYEK